MSCTSALRPDDGARQSGRLSFQRDQRVRPEVARPDDKLRCEPAIHNPLTAHVLLDLWLWIPDCRLRGNPEWRLLELLALIADRAEMLVDPEHD